METGLEQISVATDSGALPASDYWVSRIEGPPVAWESRDLELPGRGTTSVLRVFSRKPDAPTVVLLHGLAATGRLNWFTALGGLAQHFNVLVVDHRGHGRGIRTDDFQLEECAEDVIAIADALDIDTMVAAGYSMGGPIAKLCWSAHPDRVRGMVLCATANHFARPEARGLATALLPGVVMTARLAPQFFLNRFIEGITYGLPKGERLERAIIELSRSDAATLMQAARAVIRFSSHDWASNIDVPTAVVITMKDQVVPAKRQYRLASSIRGAMIFKVDSDHLACVDTESDFVPKLVEACRYVDRTSRKFAAATDPAGDYSAAN